ncbi:MAG: hypothetical protein KAR11_05580 [Phycisphaerae bacterium]|nr:hypothetical protein [Phycisphaerae bacterium]
MTESQTINVRETLQQKMRVEEIITISGTPSGTALGILTVDALKSSDLDIHLDFDGIYSMSGSAACAFWLYIGTNVGFESIGKIVFSHLEPSAMEALKYGLESAKERLNPPHKAVG